MDLVCSWSEKLKESVKTGHSFSGKLADLGFVDGLKAFTKTSFTLEQFASCGFMLSISSTGSVTLRTIII